jgi:acetylornithine deacetylase/succinyl-diaminopimelate desuccinylase-like protein
LQSFSHPYFYIEILENIIHLNPVFIIMQKKYMSLFENYKKILAQYITFKSVSTDARYQTECMSAARWLVNTFTHSGAKTALWECGTANPVVFAEYFVNKKLPTILMYGHYDVQPAEKSDGWISDPFALTLKPTKFIGRGVVDNKGQLAIHMTTVAQLFFQKQLAYNIKFIVEGNEESGNAYLPDLLHKKSKELASDYIVISDGEILGDRPTLEVSLRGGCNYTITVITGKTNVHSGLYGGAVPNAAQLLSQFIAELYDTKTRSITVPGFYDKAPKLDQKSIAENKKLCTADAVMKTSQSFACIPEHNVDFLTQVGLRPTLQITGMTSGYLGDGYANIVPCRAEVRINMRTVFPQKTADVMKAFKKHIKKNFPAYAQIEIQHTDPYDPSSMSCTKKSMKHQRITNM